MNRWLERDGWLALEEPAKSIASVVPGRSRAYCMDPGRLYLNLAGREPGGIVQPSEYEQVRDELRRWAQALPFVQRVATREEAFAGPHAEHAPDLVLVSKNGWDLKGAVRTRGAAGQGPADGHAHPGRRVRARARRASRGRGRRAGRGGDGARRPRPRHERGRRPRAALGGAARGAAVGAPGLALAGATPGSSAQLGRPGARAAPGRSEEVKIRPWSAVLRAPTSGRRRLLQGEPARARERAGAHAGSWPGSTRSTCCRCWPRSRPSGGCCSPTAARRCEAGFDGGDDLRPVGADARRSTPSCRCARSGHVDELLAAGAPDRRPAELRRLFERLVEAERGLPASSETFSGRRAGPPARAGGEGRGAGGRARRRSGCP